MKKLFLIAFLSFVVFYGVAGALTALAAEQGKTTVYLFSRQGCPHCADLKYFLKRQQEAGLPISLVEYDILADQRAGELFKVVGESFGVEVSGVPFTVVGDDFLVGYGDDQVSGARLMAMIKTEQLDPGIDVVESLVAGSRQFDDLAAKRQKTITKTFDSVWPLLTFTASIGLLDSFNPCAMWVLLLLIGLLFRLESPSRQWLLGFAFVGSSAAAYFLFLVAWFNIYDLLKAFNWLRWLVGSLSVVFALIGFRKFWLSRQGCAVEADDKKRRLIVRAVRHFAQKNNFLLALFGLVAIGVGVNLIELFCSAGLPAAYVPVLSAAGLSSWQYYAYLSLYVFFYILPQLVIFLLAMLTMRRFGLSSKVSRWFGLISALLLFLLGLAVIFRPEYLAFNF
jgi:glutaredoxin